MDPKPFLRWIGGKSKNVERFAAFLPVGIEKMTYVETFLGAGSLLFHVRPQHAVVSDINPHLINCYLSTRDDLEKLLADLEIHDINDSESYYYSVRDDFNASSSVPYDVQDAWRASEFIYLNARCFNGLYRENSKGKMDAPFAKDLKGLKKICNPDLFQSVSKYLGSNDIVILNNDFAYVLENIDDWGVEAFFDGKVFYFFDPPYESPEKASSYTGYVSGKWTREQTIRLKELADGIDAKGNYFYVCNHATPFVRELFAGYHQHEHVVSRSASCDAQNRKPAEEIVVTNYNAFLEAPDVEPARKKVKAW